VPTSGSRERQPYTWDPFSRSYGAILQSSLTRVLSRALVLLHSPTCVGFGTGTIDSTLRGFSWHHGFNQLSVPKDLPDVRHQRGRRVFLSSLASHAAGLCRGSGWPILMRHPIAPRSWCRNIDVLSIDYAFRPRLRSRLTLRGRPLLRNPWAFGGRDSHPSYRYSFLHSHFRYLHGSLRYRFNGLRNAPLPSTPRVHCRSFGAWLSPDHLRRRDARLVSYYALFKGMAASKPTS